MQCFCSLAQWMDFFGLHDSSKYIGTPQSVAIRNPDCTIVNHLISLVGFFFFLNILCSFSNLVLLIIEQHSGAVVSTVASHQEGSKLKPSGQLGTFCVKIACSPMPYMPV